MFIVEINYTAPLTEIDKYTPAHREFLDYYYKNGLLMASGPMIPRTGGIIIALTKDKEYLQSILQQDPYYLAQLAEYKLIEFTPLKHCVELRELILKTEGKLC